MISHIVLFEPRESLSADERRAILDAVTAAAARCPAVRACRVGRRILHGLPGYEQAMRDDYQHALVLEFDDRQGLLEYLTHPAHARAGELFTSAAARSLAYDFEMLEIADARALL